MKILVTGAAGFIGSNTVDFLSKKRYKVLALDNFSSGKTENLKEFRGGVEICDVTDLKMMDVVFDKFRPDSVIHLAAQSAITTAWTDPDKDAKVNIRGTLNVITLSKIYDVRKIVFSSTSAVYGKKKHFPSNEKDVCSPDTPYGISKLAAEYYIRLCFPNHVILRYANIYGPRQIPVGENQVVARALAHLSDGSPFHVVGDGNQKRDFVYIDDLVYANYLALTSSETGTFNVASGVSHSVNKVMKEIEVAQALPSFPWSHSKDQDLRGSVYLSGKRFRNIFGWTPMVDLSTGIRLTADWWHGSPTVDTNVFFDK